METKLLLREFKMAALHSTSLILVLNTILTFQSSVVQDLSEQIDLCGSPIQFTLKNVNKWKSHSSVALFSIKGNVCISIK